MARESPGERHRDEGDGRNEHERDRQVARRIPKQTGQGRPDRCTSLADREYEAFRELIGTRPRQLYGMTETIPAVLTSPPLEPMPDSIGRPTLGCDVRLDVPDGEGEPAPGEVGEIAVAGRPGIELFAGYLDDPETTAASFRDGLFLTGDLAYRDEEGRYRFAGRRGDVLKVAGENVSTVEVESVLAEHPGVLDCAVVGEPDEVRDEVPVAHVVRAEGNPGLRRGGAHRMVLPQSRAFEGAPEGRLPHRATADLCRQDPQVRAPLTTQPRRKPL